MLFKRHKKLHPVHHVRNVLWPKLGWGRAMRYLLHRVGRLPATPYSIAAGFACGAAISFTPFMGFHIVFAALIAWLIGGNVLASALGTIVGNPWTFPFIWLWSFNFGNWLLQTDATQTAPNTLTLQIILDHPDWLLWPMMVGGVPTAILAWFVFYWPIRTIVANYQRRRHHRREAGKLRGAMRRAANSKIDSAD